MRNRKSSVPALTMFRLAPKSLLFEGILLMPSLVTRGGGNRGPQKSRSLGAKMVPLVQFNAVALLSTTGNVCASPAPSGEPPPPAVPQNAAEARAPPLLGLLPVLGWAFALRSSPALSGDSEPDEQSDASPWLRLRPLELSWCKNGAAEVQIEGDGSRSAASAVGSLTGGGGRPSPFNFCGAATASSAAFRAAMI